MDLALYLNSRKSHHPSHHRQCQYECMPSEQRFSYSLSPLVNAGTKILVGLSIMPNNASARSYKFDQQRTKYCSTYWYSDISRPHYNFISLAVDCSWAWWTMATELRELGAWSTLTIWLWMRLHPKGYTCLSLLPKIVYQSHVHTTICTPYIDRKVPVRLPVLVFRAMLLCSISVAAFLPACAN